MRSESFYTDMFALHKRDLEQVMSKAACGGASYADLYFENSLYRSLTLRDSIVSSGGFHIDYGVGIRVVCGERTGYSYCETTRMEDMLKAAKVAGSIVQTVRTDGVSPTGIPVSGVPHVAVSSPLPSTSRAFYPDGSGWDSVDLSQAESLLCNIEENLRSRDPRIEKVIARLSCSDSHIMMYNSLDELCFDSRPLWSVAVTCIFSKGGIRDNCSVSRSFRCGRDVIFGKALSERIVDDLLHNIDPLLEAGRPKGGRMSVVMGAGASGILLHEAMGHAFEADFNRKGQSVFSGRMGQQVCPAGINIVDDATFISNRGSMHYDDEGVRGQKTYMVMDGKLNSYLHDRISAEHYHVAPTGNGRRESFRYPPIPRMRLTYMENGTASPGDIIASVKKGVWVDEFSNGQVQIGQGDFTFYVKSGRLIENGRLTRPIKDINIIGNGPKALQDIVAVGNDLRIDDSCWTCGKDQSVSVGCGMPTVLVKGLTVGGE